ncbi:MAG: 1-acyl-sn-glycerol-3-phosphate acyltransferase [Candidatus Dormibacteria bacterium]
MTPPPLLVRRCLLEPLFVVVTLLALVLSPLILLVAACASPLVEGRWRPLRVAAYTLLWMLREVAGIVLCTLAWVLARGRTSRPRWQQLHYGAMRWFLRGARRLAGSILGVTVRVTAGPCAAQALGGGEVPLIVLSRHAGPGDTFFLVDLLLDRWERAPRIVLKEMLRLDPVIDLAAGRLPCYFVPPPRRRSAEEWEQAIGDLSSGMDAKGALLLFPEGGNFTEERRRRRLRQLLRRGLRRQAEQAVRMHNVIAPQPGGTLAAIAANPAAGVVFVAHNGLSGLGSGGLVRRAPLDQEWHVHVWYVAPADVPAEAARPQWLLDWWGRVDAWVAEHAAGAAPSPARG